jgi:Nuclease-related domain
MRRRHRDGTPQRHGQDEEAARRTDALLRGLPAREWTVLEDFDLKHGVDHVVVGPSGVFAIVSRFPELGGARVRDGVLWLRRGADARADRPSVAINRQALDAARALHREIRARTGRGPEVCPVVVLWCEFPQRVAESSRIAFVHGRDLRSWLSHRPALLDDAGRREIVQAVNSIPRGPHHRLRAPHLPSRRRAA